MTKFPFKLNGVDFSHLVHKYGYETDARPVYASRYTNLAGRKRSVVRRWEHPFTVTLNDMTAEDAAQLGAMLLQAPLDVTHLVHQRGRETTVRMMVEDYTLAHKLSTSRADWLAGTALVFVEE